MRNNIRNAVDLGIKSGAISWKESSPLTGLISREHIEPDEERKTDEE